ncbi:MAG TPA: sigma-70 family RNA polymerase sigma factor [Verrucomicrobiae bacterium]|jgi:RNA polymerase sigma-70 factor (ECF subfamily)|nr:sigma-70 family RNA polymerase sigma factor [Verrucomicrobiae bacterium]
MATTQHGDDLIPTRATLIGRLKDPKDQSSWQEFFDTYSKLIYGVARKAGLTESGAQNVLQATMEAVAENMPSFKYDPEMGSFKAWLLNLTRLQIITQVCKPRSASREVTTAADPSGRAVEHLWEKEWDINLLESATTNVKRRLEPRKYQVYDLQVNKQWAAEKVAALMGKPVDEVLEAKRSVAEMIQAEARRLEQEML